MKALLQEQFGYLFEDSLITEIASVGKLHSFEENSMIIDINEEMQFVPILVEGTVKILREDDNGDELAIYYLEKGDTCSMSLTCCMAKSKSKIRAITESDATLIMIPREKLQHWMDKYPGWRDYILQSYQIRFDEMLDTIDALAFLKMDERLLRHLKDKVKLNGNTAISNTHKEIANDLHTSRVVISRLLKKLEKEGKIALHRNRIELLLP